MPVADPRVRSEVEEVEEGKPFDPVDPVDPFEVDGSGPREKRDSMPPGLPAGASTREEHRVSGSAAPREENREPESGCVAPREEKREEVESGSAREENRVSGSVAPREEKREVEAGSARENREVESGSAREEKREAVSGSARENREDGENRPGGSGSFGSPSTRKLAYLLFMALEGLKG